MKTAVNVDAYLAEAGQWQPQIKILRAVLLDCGLEETVKWGAPCYAWKGKNVVGLGAFKSYLGLWFHQGALLTDDAGVLINAQEGKTRAQRQWRFQMDDKLDRALIKLYVVEAIDLVERGRAVAPERNKALALPTELTQALARDKVAKEAFKALSPGKQREYAEHIGSAKQEGTRLRRLEKALPMILAGVGLNDKYR